MEGKHCLLIKNKIIEILTSHIISEDQPDFSLKIRDIGIDSLAFIKSIVEIEEEYKIEVEDDLLNIGQYNSTYEFIEKISAFIDTNIKNDI